MDKKMEELGKKAKQFNETYELTEEQQDMLAREQRKLLVDKYTNISEFNDKLQRGSDNGTAFNKLAQWYLGYQEGIPLSYESCFQNLVDLAIIQRGVSKAKNIERVREIYEDYGIKDQEHDNKFKAFLDHLLVKIDKHIDLLQQVGIASFELNLEAIENLQARGIKLYTKDEIKRRAKREAISNKRKRK